MLLVQTHTCFSPHFLKGQTGFDDDDNDDDGGGGGGSGTFFPIIPLFYELFVEPLCDIIRCPALTETSQRH